MMEAVEEVQRTLHELGLNTVMMTVDHELVKYIIGKKGAVINKLRQETGATIETDLKDGRICIYSADPAVREAARECINRIVDKNQVRDAIPVT
jgi:polyribonucleotide nucleotidyltransferase